MALTEYKNIWNTPKNEWEKQPVINFDSNDENLINDIKTFFSSQEVDRLNIFKVKEDISEEILSMKLT